MTRETGDRCAFLATVRRAVSATHAPSHRPVAPLPDGAVPPVAYRAADEDPVDQFIDAVTALGGVARRLRDAAEIAAFIDDALEAARGNDRPTRAAVSADPECELVRAWLVDRDDVEFVDDVATADIGFTGARAAVAQTGSIVVDARRARSRSVGLLPPLHVALVDVAALVATPGDLWRTMTKPMPSNVVQITGPSRSADIELIITLGVHGPRALWVGLVESGG